MFVVAIDSLSPACNSSAPPGRLLGVLATVTLWLTSVPAAVPVSTV
jgi:hypothetical protein